MQKWEHIHDGFYLVMNERGFDQAFVHFWGRKPKVHEVPREVPALYPSVVTFVKLTDSDGKLRADGDHVSVSWIPVDVLQRVLRR